jgi:hypothetical protein
MSQYNIKAGSQTALFLFKRLILFTKKCRYIKKQPLREKNNIQSIANICEHLICFEKYLA